MRAIHTNTTKVLVLLIALLLAPLISLHAAEARPAALFSNHMVLQRDRPAPIWGSAEPNDEVTVEFAGQKKTAKADANGQWLIKLDPLSAESQGRDLIVQSSKHGSQFILIDVVVGDVWLCSGQSNMHFRMKSVENSEREIAAADHPGIRLFTVRDQFALQPAGSVQGDWLRCSPQTAGDCPAVAYYFARELHQKQRVPIGLLISSIGGTRIETWINPATLAAIGESGPLVEKWRNVSLAEFDNIATAYRAYQYQRDHIHPQAVKAAKAQGTPIPPEPLRPKLRCHDCPSALHHGMIAPLQPFAIRGAIWYQGESNSGQPAVYEKLLPAMIADWRRVWGDQLPFLFVQLAPHRNTHPAFREAQLRIWQKIPHTAMVVTTDVGDAQNIHPTRKRPVGERLALAARALSYGEKLEYSGPLFKELVIEGNRAVVSFTHLGAGLMSREGPLQGFTIAGEDGKFIPAQAVIQNSTVVVTADQIKTPAAVRYGWAMVPDGNLFNREGLPAAPFRSDAPADSKPVLKSE